MSNTSYTNVSYNQPHIINIPSTPKIVVSPNEIGFKFPDAQITGIGGNDLLITITDVSAVLFLANQPNTTPTAHFSLSMSVTCNGWFTFLGGQGYPAPTGMYFGLSFLNAFGGALKLWNTPRFAIQCNFVNVPQVWSDTLDPNLFPLTEAAKLTTFSDALFFGCHGLKP